jgi:DNA-binding CsgD family transcriptional regulator
MNPSTSPTAPDPITPVADAPLDGSLSRGVEPPLWAFFRSIFESAPEAIAMLDGSLRVVVWNRAAVESTGHEVREIVGRRCRLEGVRLTLDLAEDGAGDEDPPSRARLSTLCEFRIRTPTGASRPRAATVIPLQHDASALLVLPRDAGDGNGGPPDAGESSASAGVGDIARRASWAGRQLTEREQQILELLAAGKTAKAIAAELSLSLPTVRSHTQHILRKLGVHSALEAVVWFLRTAGEGTS